jgi:hypothetical protein
MKRSPSKPRWSSPEVALLVWAGFAAAAALSWIVIFAKLFGAAS